MSVGIPIPIAHGMQYDHAAIRMSYRKYARCRAVDSAPNSRGFPSLRGAPMAADTALDAWGYNPLDQISRENVSDLRLVWTRALSSSYRDLSITQKSAWHLAMRIRESWDRAHTPFEGPVEVDETHVGGKARSMHSKRKRQIGIAGNPLANKVTVAGVKDRESGKVKVSVVPDIAPETLHSTAPRRPRWSPAMASRRMRRGRATKRLSTRPASTCASKRASTAWSPSGRCSSAATTGRTTG